MLEVWAEAYLSFLLENHAAVVKSVEKALRRLDTYRNILRKGLFYSKSEALSEIYFRHDVWVTLAATLPHQRV